MTKWDKDYLELCKSILKEGIEVENRTGINTIKVPSHNFHFDLGKEFPILQTKQLFFKNAITEILWIYQAQSNNVKWLHDRSNKVWNEWMIDKDGIYRTYRPLTDNDEYESHFENGVEYIDNEIELFDLNGNKILNKIGDPIKVKAFGENSVITEVEHNEKTTKTGKIITSAKFFGRKYAETIGTAYGWIVNRYKLTDKLLDTIKNNPTDRRLVISLWQNEWLKTAVLPSCVWSSEWDVTNGKLNAWVHQRSCDVPLGLPFNVTQYATLLSLFAKVSNLEPGTLDWSIKDAHIYVNQVDGIKEQIERGNILDSINKMKKSDLLKLKQRLEDEQFDVGITKENDAMLKAAEITLDKEKPYLWINPEIKNFYDYDNSKDLKDIKVKQYKHMGKITFPIAQ